jgi:AcrR family transcriptional regulator
MSDHRHLAVAREPSSATSRGPSFAATRCADPRRRILDALIATVARRGYDRTTLQRVLHVAQVPAPVFDEHFENKQDCFLQAIDELIGHVECIVLERIDRPAPWPERVRRGLQSLLCALASHPDGARVAMVESLGAGEPAIARLRSALIVFVPILEEGMTLAKSTEHLPPQISEAVVGGIASIIHRRVLEGHTAELPALLPDLLYFALMPYLGHHRALTAASLSAAA